ncbi:MULTISPECIES: UdgX family uracil-DNA binding protein [unclassified Rhizobium]|uniref:UdgX family uracil-DNA binding protein n=1 Tax=unclassified Rhizobium TaxID=2613769 RepID=UPI0006FFCB91|nr:MULTISPECIES: UdgX family uracil-DNA binding protein [unclassified Rhizobium]KQV38017.1 DNA polymerase [Rhizobium sp. Root1212]KRD30675.1 DNA polymerase [Rhizobium sp. Root268]
MHRIVLEGRGDLSEWRRAARGLFAAKVLPEDIDWRVRADAADDLFDMPAADTAKIPAVSASSLLTVPKAFLSLAEAVICHSDPARFGRLYGLLFRLQAEPSLLAIRADADVAALRTMEKSVRRDCHKMTAFVRFKEIPDGGYGRRRRFFAWFEPDHYIVSRVAPFFQRRFTDMDWMIATPKGTAAWDGEELHVSSSPAENPKLSDQTETLWRTYFRHIFNPARLKVKMMQTEMPKKYWKNLPEAELIPDMIASAEAEVIAMAERAATDAPLFHTRLQAAAKTPVASAVSEPTTLAEAREQAMACMRCPLHCNATQTVFGEGPENADIMIVGEQPGDQEDLAGRPFVGPAGRVFDEAAQAVGLDRTRVYVTNAVKHFKYELRGKRRIHQKPNLGEVQHCKWWLKLELDFVKPKLVVAMGATAVASLTGRQQKLGDLRGDLLDIDTGGSMMVTVHPSYLLRLPDHGRQQEELARFRADLAEAVRFDRQHIQPTMARPDVGNQRI